MAASGGWHLLSNPAVRHSFDQAVFEDYAALGGE
jgi:hypothetical protein